MQGYMGMFERMDIAEQVYEGGKKSKNTQWAEDNRASLGRKQNGGGATSPYNPEKGRAEKCKRNHSGHLSDDLNGAKNTCLMHRPRHSS